MSYTLPLPCGCTAYVACWPDTGVAHTRVIEFRHAACRVRTHERGTKVFLWDLLPEPRSVEVQVAGVTRTVRIGANA